MIKILICDDEEGLRKIIRKYAENEGYVAYEAKNGLEAVQLENSENFDLIIMDIMMPELDGFSAVKEIRKTSNVPIIMVSARGEEYDKMLGFELGVDDYVVKPFSSKELMFRIQAILRRVGKNQNKSDIVKINGLVVDMSAYKVSIDDKVLQLAPKEYELLFLLVRNMNIAMQRSQIIETVWGYDYDGDDRTLDTHMKLLRKSLGEYASHIKTIRNVGYRFDEKE